MESNGRVCGLHVVMFPYFGFGHIVPFLHLARKICAARPHGGGIRITILSAPANVPRITALLTSSPSVHILPLEIPAVDGLPPGAESTADITPAMAELLKVALDLMKPQIASLLAQLKPEFIVYDFAQSWLPSIAHPLNIKTLFFSVFAAASTAYLTVPARRLHGDSPTIDDLRKPPEGFPSAASIAGVPPYQAADFLYLFKRFGGGPRVFDRVLTCWEDCTAIIAKTCTEMEGAYLEYVESQYGKPVLLAGPVVPEPPAGELEGKWAEWLTGFPEGSVVFCSFGSETFLSDDAVRELVIGLEMVELPFLVVLNFPRGGGEEELKGKLPDGFEGRVKGRGWVHQGWVPQQLILRHRSVGCFVCHAGLSSLVEGVVADCQLVMLPQKGDQYLNAALFAGDLGAGVVVARDPADGNFRREDIYESVRKVTVEAGEEPGRTVRYNHRRLREFLMDEEVQDKFTEDLVEKMEALAAA